MARILYITHTGLAEPLGQSQVLGYLKPLAAQNSIHLISFEKTADFFDQEKIAQVQQQCDEVGITLTRHRFRTAPRYFSTAINVAVLFFSSLRHQRKSNAQIIHARSYLPSLVAALVSKVSSAKFVFDMRALWPEELIGAGRVRRGAIVHKCLKKVEQICLNNAGAIVSLTHAAISYLKDEYPSTKGKSFHVIPTCVDLQRFSLANETRVDKIFGCSGTVISGFFRFDLLARVFGKLAVRFPDARFEVVTKDDADLVMQKLREAGVPTERLTVRPSPPQEMPNVHAGHSASLMFFTTNTGKLGSCPTRMGEALACGTPVLINPGIGDVTRIADGSQGVALLTGKEDGDIDAAIDDLASVMAQDDLPRLCRDTAEKVFSLSAGVEEYQRIYDALAKDH